MSTLFVSDVHLNAARPHIVRDFIGFLDTKARDADALYILGDLFDLWLGDDDDKPPHGEICDALAAATGAGLPVSILLGNHDFLLGRRFLKRTGCRMLDDHTVIDVYGTPTLVLHGDTLCTRDLEYQKFRRMTRNRLRQWLFLAMPLAKREAKAARIKSAAQEDVALKSDDIMDVTQEAVAELMREHRVRHMIHGHTHRPAIHSFDLDGEEARRIVLGDWYERDSVLIWDETGYRLGRLGDL